MPGALVSVSVSNTPIIPSQEVSARPAASADATASASAKVAQVRHDADWLLHALDNSVGDLQGGPLKNTLKKMVAECRDATAAACASQQRLRTAPNESLQNSAGAYSNAIEKHGAAFEKLQTLQNHLELNKDKLKTHWFETAKTILSTVFMALLVALTLPVLPMGLITATLALDNYEQSRPLPWTQADKKLQTLQKQIGEWEKTATTNMSNDCEAIQLTVRSAMNGFDADRVFKTNLTFAKRGNTDFSLQMLKYAVLELTPAHTGFWDNTLKNLIEASAFSDERKQECLEMAERLTSGTSTLPQLPLFAGMADAPGETGNPAPTHQFGQDRDIV